MNEMSSPKQNELFIGVCGTGFRRVLKEKKKVTEILFVDGTYITWENVQQQSNKIYWKKASKKQTSLWETNVFLFTDDIEYRYTRVCV